MKLTVGEKCGGRLYIALRAGTRRWWKRASSKARRRLERADPENAPRKDRHRGYAD